MRKLNFDIFVTDVLYGILCLATSISCLFWLSVAYSKMRVGQSFPGNLYKLEHVGLSTHAKKC